MAAYFSDTLIFGNRFAGQPAEFFYRVEQRASLGISRQQIAGTQVLRKWANGAFDKYGVTPVAFTGIQKAVEMVAVILHARFLRFVFMPVLLLYNFLQKIPPTGIFKGERKEPGHSKMSRLLLVLLFRNGVFSADFDTHKNEYAERSGSNPNPQPEIEIIAGLRRGFSWFFRLFRFLRCDRLIDEAHTGFIFNQHGLTVFCDLKIEVSVVFLETFRTALFVKKIAVFAQPAGRRPARFRPGDLQRYRCLRHRPCCR